MVESFYEKYLEIKAVRTDSTVFQWVGSDGKSVCSRTYREFSEDIGRYVSYLKDRIGELAGKHIAILARNRYEYFAAIFAGLLANFVLVPLNYQKDLSELLDEMERADVTAVICDPDSLEWLPELPERFDGELIDMLGYKSYPVSEIRDTTDLEALAMIVYTSGTTGRSKGVMLSQKNLLSAFRINGYPSYMDFLRRVTNNNFTYLSVLPLFHLSGLKTFDFFFEGFVINICESPKYFYRDLSLMPSSCVILVPAFYGALLQDLRLGRRSRLEPLSLFYTGGADANIEAISCLMDNGYYIEQRYGLTESTSIGTKNFSQDKKKISSIGQAENIMEIRLDNGELCLRGDAVFMGYYKDPEGTAEVLDADGWLHTGDLASVDEDGYYYITGRKKNLIILASGENVSPEELEARLRSDADILETIVKEKDGRIAAEIYCEAEKQQAVRDFVRELNKSLPTYKFIAKVEFRDTPFERTGSGKLKR